MSVVREAYGFAHVDTSRLKEVYGGPTGQVFVGWTPTVGLRVFRGV